MHVTATDLVSAAKQVITEIDPATVLGLLGKIPLLDVREPDEYAAGCLPGAVNIPRGVLEFRIDAHPALGGTKDSDLILYCQSGGRSALAAQTLAKLGYTRALSLAGGFKAWSEAGLPTMKPAG